MARAMRTTLTSGAAMVERSAKRPFAIVEIGVPMVSSSKLLWIQGPTARELTSGEDWQPPVELNLVLQSAKVLVSELCDLLATLSSASTAQRVEGASRSMPPGERAELANLLSDRPRSSHQKASLERLSRLGRSRGFCALRTAAASPASMQAKPIDSSGKFVLRALCG